MQPPPYQLDEYDPYRLIIHMTLVSVSICSIGILVSAFAMYQKVGLSLFNTRIDILGDYLHSPLAIVYNISLLLTGSSFILAMLSLIYLNLHRFIQTIAYAGIASGISIILLGIFPLNFSPAHGWVSLFFYGITGLFFGLIIGSKWLNKLWCHPMIFHTSVLGGICVMGILWHFDFQRVDLMSAAPSASHDLVANLLWIHATMILLSGLGLALTVHRLTLERYQATHNVI
ncbi:hypothetical protein [Shewanella sp. NIFS-20-20]|uniref:hypothetical protein n=1 Tax=Shewanella sp. NIFS-20-20 TaxID=2853806 RepID=UPI001C4770AE|nr:hypothetical protein [Shewanella sp. NIFS-20-20]MBV7314120.1 hypothetical protein [Shewanella sp. NIFS-20-20]